MSERQDLEQAKYFIAENKEDQAAEILWRLYKSSDQIIRLDTILVLLYALDKITGNENLIKITDEGLKAASMIGRGDLKAYLFSKKCTFLSTKLSLLIYRQKNLMLSANIFEWIEFSLKKDKEEYDAIILQRKELEKEISTTIKEVLGFTELSTDHYFRGLIFMTLGDFYSSKLLNDKLDFIVGGKIRSKMGNMYYVRRWNLDRLLLYKSKNRRKITADWKMFVHFFKDAIREFKAGEYEVDMAYAYYNLAAKMKNLFHFMNAKKYLKQSQCLAKKNNEKDLLRQIALLRKSITDKNKNIRNYAEELGLDLP